jgi:DNA-binding GntR family transcriptional regulator
MNTPSAPGDEEVPTLARFALPAGVGALSRGSMPSAVADILREAILDGQLAPGAWLREAEVARELQVSRTPIRDAFRILAAEGLVNINANQGAVVSPMTGEDVIELYVMREVLEGLASRLAARRAAQRCLEEFAVLIPEMKRVGEAGEIRQLSRLNFQFHAIVCEAAGNRYLDRSLSQIQNAARRFPDPTLGLPGRVKESIEEHVMLADAISRGDAAEAEKLAIGHMRHLSELRIEMLLRH